MPEHEVVLDDRGRVVVDGVGTFERRGTATRRASADALVEAGSPVVLDYDCGGVMVCLTGRCAPPHRDLLAAVTEPQRCRRTETIWPSRTVTVVTHR